eukprot:763381-Hanusia_phi.AAC.1
MEGIGSGRSRGGQEQSQGGLGVWQGRGYWWRRWLVKGQGRHADVGGGGGWSRGRRHADVGGG